MTAKEWAEKVDIVVDAVGDPRDPQNYVDYDGTAANIEAAITAAVAEEREACRAIALAHAEWARTQLCGPNVSPEYRDGQAVAAEAIARRIAERGSG